MVFNSLSFVFFFTIFCAIYFALTKQFRLFFILVASIVFYYFFSPKGLFILGGVIVFNFYSGIFIERWKRKERILILSIVANALLLFVFKYFDFFDSSLTDLLHNLGIKNPVPLLHLLLPAGISFYTLQAIGYNVDVYNGMQEAEKKFTVFATYFFFFPKIAQGPVERPRNLLPQMNSENKIDYAGVTNGLRLAVWGLFKKVIIADRLALLVDEVYGHPHNYSGLSLLMAGLFYTFQLYADFSGYTDMALGIAEIMGFRIMKNFNHPFASTSVTDFWKRWHISFSTWLFEYIYNPLSLTKRSWGVWGMVYAVFITFMISGLWHGVGWTFLLWGVFNGIALSYEILTIKARKKFWKSISPQTAKYSSIAITFIFTVLSFTFARANNLRDGIYIMKSSFAGLKEIPSKYMNGTLNLHPGMVKLDFWISLISIALILVYHVLEYRINILRWLNSRPIVIRWGIYYIIILTVLWFGVYDNKKFIYFQF